MGEEKRRKQIGSRKWVAKLLILQGKKGREFKHSVSPERD